MRAVVDGVEQSDSLHAIQFRAGYKDVSLSPPAGSTTPDGVAHTYEANDEGAAAGRSGVCGRTGMRVSHGVAPSVRGRIT